MKDIIITKGKYDGYRGTVSSEYNGIKTLLSTKKWYNVIVNNNGSRLVLPSSSIKKVKKFN